MKILSKTTVIQAGIAIFIIAIIGFIHFSFFQGNWWIQNHETEMYSIRAEEFAHLIKQGILYPRWAFDFYGTYGSAFFNFYGPTTFYISALPILFGSTPLFAGQFLIFTIETLLAVGAYLFVRRATKNIALGAAAAFLLVFSPISLVWIYARGGLAAALSLSLTSFIFWFALRYIQTQRIINVLGMSILLAMFLMTHAISDMIATSFVLLGLAAIIMIYSKKEERKRNILYCTAYAFFGILMSSIYTLPLFFETNLVTSNVLVEKGGLLHYASNFIKPLSVVLPIRSLQNFSYYHPEESLYFSSAIIAVACFGILMFVKRILVKRFIIQKERILGFFFLVITGITIFFATSYSGIFYKYLPKLQFIQQPWRFLHIAQLYMILGALFLIAPVIAIKKKIHQGILGGIIVTIVFLSGFPLYNSLVQNRRHEQNKNDDKILTSIEEQGRAATYATNAVTTTLGDEYLPIWTGGNTRPTKEAFEGILEEQVAEGAKNNIIDVKQQGKTFTLTLENEHDETITVKHFYFPGQKAKTQQGEKLSLYPSATGLITISDIPSSTKTVQLLFGESKKEKIGTAVSIMTFIVALVFTGWNIRRQRTNEEELNIKKVSKRR